MRNKCSNLNSDLYNNHIAISPNCVCGTGIEDAEHFLFKCSRFTAQRRQLFLKTRQYHPLNTDKLLHGYSNLNDEQNSYIFQIVHTYIVASNRFKTNEVH